MPSGTRPKPWLLWGWRIQIGASDIAYHEVRRSPFDRSGALRAILVTYRTLNPLLTTLALIAALALTVAALRRDANLPAVATGALALYVTLVHVVLQAEPRYAIAYRGLEADPRHDGARLGRRSWRVEAALQSDALRTRPATKWRDKARHFVTRWCAKRLKNRETHVNS